MQTGSRLRKATSMHDTKTIRSKVPAPPPGTVVSVLVFTPWPVRHMGIVTDRRIGGLPTVISNSKKVGQVEEESWKAFAGEGAVRVEGYLGRLHHSVVLARAFSRLGDPWRLSDSNCEHFVRWAHGVELDSPQIRFGATMALLVALGAVAARSG